MVNQFYKKALHRYFIKLVCQTMYKIHFRGLYISYKVLKGVYHTTHGRLCYHAKCGKLIIIQNVVVNISQKMCDGLTDIKHYACLCIINVVCIVCDCVTVPDVKHNVTSNLLDILTQLNLTLIYYCAFHILSHKQQDSHYFIKFNCK